MLVRPTVKVGASKKPRRTCACAPPGAPPSQSGHPLQLSDSWALAECLRSTCARRPAARLAKGCRRASSSAAREGRGCEAAGGRRAGRDKVAVELELLAELVVRHVGDASTARRLAVALVAPDLASPPGNLGELAEDWSWSAMTWPLPGGGTRPHHWRSPLSAPEQGTAPPPARSAWPPP